MATNLEKFKYLVENWHDNNNLQDTQLNYGLFMKLWKENYPNKNLLSVASEFVDILKKMLDDEWKHKWWVPFQKACISHLFKEANLEINEAKEKITNHLEQPSTGVPKNILGDLGKEVVKVGSVMAGDELIAFLQLFKEHISIYNERLKVLSRKYQFFKRVILLYACQLFGASQQFTITRHAFKNIKSERGSNYLFSPSHAHYLINSQETVFMLVRTTLGSGGALEKELKTHKTKAERVYLFTFDSGLSDNLFTEFREENVQIVTTESIKNKNYQNNREIITLEELLSLCKSKRINFWRDYKFSKQEKTKVRSLFKQKAKKHENFPILRDWYQEQVEELEDFVPISKVAM